VIQESVRNRDRLVEQAARIVAQVQDIALQRPAGLVLQLLDRLFEPRRGLLVERGDPQVADFSLQSAAHRLHGDDGACNGDIEGFAPGPPEGQHEVRVDGTAHLFDRFGERQAKHRISIQMADQVARLHAGTEGRRVVDGRNHLDQAVFHGDLDAQAPEFALGLNAHVLKGLGVQIARMGIQVGQHAADGGFNQLLVRDFLHIIGTHPLEDVPEQLELPVCLGFLVLGGRRLRNEEKNGDRQGRYTR
jgi:hypothetical protein